MKFYIFFQIIIIEYARQRAYDIFSNDFAPAERMHWVGEIWKLLETT